MSDKNYMYMEYGGNKPCVYVVAVLEDLRKRMYHANLLEHIYEVMVRIHRLIQSNALCFVPLMFACRLRIRRRVWRTCVRC